MPDFLDVTFDAALTQKRMLRSKTSFAALSGMTAISQKRLRQIVLGNAEPTRSENANIRSALNEVDSDG